MTDHVISRTVGHVIPRQDQRWRIDDGPPRYETFEEAIRALPPESVERFGPRCPYPKGV
jgi:hypothetical protein